MRLLPIMTLVLLGVISCSSPANNGALSIVDAWARPANLGDNSAVYFVIENPTPAQDTLLGAYSEQAGTTEMHMTMSMEPPRDATGGPDAVPGIENGVMRMAPQASVLIPPNAAVSFEPGGLHIMLIALHRDLQTGDTLHLTLEFEQAGIIEIAVPVAER